MALTKYKIGQLIKIVDERNSFGIRDFYGININKDFMPTVADTEDLDESKYKVVRKNRFVFSGMQTGRDECIRISMYLKEKPIIVSPAYTTFEIVAKDIVLPTYFFMIFMSKEKDRLGAFYSDGSIRTNLDWDRFCDIELNLPDLPTQQKYVDIYKAMVANQQSYERGLDNLKTVFTAYIEKLKHAYPLQSFSPFITERQEINKNATYSNLVGVGNEGFITPRGARDKDTFYKCNIFYYKDFVYNPSVVSKGAIALNLDVKVPQICTEEYIVFYVSDETVLLPEYLFIWLKREETGRYLEFFNMDSVRNRVYFQDLECIKIPIPSISEQKAVSDIYKCFYERKKINERLKAQIKDICPILIRGSLEEGKA